MLGGMKRGKKWECRVLAVADLLLEKLAQAASELDTQYLKENEKIRQSCFDAPEGTKKPSREIVTERESLCAVKSGVDRSGLKVLISALKELQQLYQEQGADREEAYAAIRVMLEGEVEEFGK